RRLRRQEPAHQRRRGGARAALGDRRRGRGGDPQAGTRATRRRAMTSPQQTDAITPTLERALRVAPPRRHVLDLDDFSPEEITLVLDSAKAMKDLLGRDIKKA